MNVVFALKLSARFDPHQVGGGAADVGAEAVPAAGAKGPGLDIRPQYNLCHQER